MEDSIISEYYGIIFDKMKIHGLLSENGTPRSLSEDDFCRYCKQIIRDSELETLRVEFMALEELVNGYQERFNIIVSVHKSFFEETPHGKKYKYLHIEQILLTFHYTPVRFMDWLLGQYCYMQFSRVLPDYIEYLYESGLEACYDCLSRKLYLRLYP